MSWPAHGIRTRVLVVEHQPDSNFCLSRLLHHLGCDYDVSRVGRQGLNRAIQFQPHVVLLDMELLGRDGYSIALALRHQAGTQPMIVAITTDGEEHRTECESSGVDLHVYRPVELNTLRIILEEAGWKATSRATQSEEVALARS